LQGGDGLFGHRAHDDSVTEVDDKNAMGVPAGPGGGWNRDLPVSGDRHDVLARDLDRHDGIV